MAIDSSGNQDRHVVFLDKDGTLIENVAYNVDPALMRFAPTATEGLRIIAEVGYDLVVVTNQSGVARGYFEEEALSEVEAGLRKMVREAAGVDLLGFYYCPHHPEGKLPPYNRACDCRKPEPGMLLRAATELHIDRERSWMVGDILNDVEAGRRSGCRTVLVDRGHETEWVPGPKRTPHFVVHRFVEAAHIIAVSDGRRDVPRQGMEGA